MHLHNPDLTPDLTTSLPPRLFLSPGRVLAGMRKSSALCTTHGTIPVLLPTPLTSPRLTCCAQSPLSRSPNPRADLLRASCVWSFIHASEP